MLFIKYLNKADVDILFAAASKKEYVVWWQGVIAVVLSDFPNHVEVLELLLLLLLLVSCTTF